MRAVFLGLCALALAGCQLNEDKMVKTSASPDDTCGKAAFADLVGEPVGIQDWDALEQDVRVIPPDSAVTMDHRPDRLNVDVNRDGDIARLWCG